MSDHVPIARHGFLVRATQNNAVRMRAPGVDSWSTHVYGARRMSVPGTLASDLSVLVSDLANFYGTNYINFNGGTQGNGNFTFGYDIDNNDMIPGAFGSENGATGETGKFLPVTVMGDDGWPGVFVAPSGGVGLPNLYMIMTVANWHAASGFCVIPAFDNFDGTFSGYRLGAFRKFCTIATALNVAQSQSPPSASYFVIEAKYGVVLNADQKTVSTQWEYRLISTGNNLNSGYVLGPGPGTMVDLPVPANIWPIAPLTNGRKAMGIYRAAVVNQDPAAWASANGVKFLT